MRIVVCPDSFKGSMTAFEVTEIITDSIKDLQENIEVVSIPLADGGEGTASILYPWIYDKIETVKTVDALGRPIEAQYLVCGKRAFIESATSVGIGLLKPEELNPKEASSFGLGLMIKDAIEKGYREISISLGGIAVCDGGMGMLEALGYRFYDAKDKTLKGNGKNLIKIAKISPSNHPNPNNLKITAICDVKNPLYGSNGAAYVFAPQKGAKPEDLPLLDSGLRNLAHLSLGTCHPPFVTCHSREGAGAAGGLGFALYAFLNAELENGIEFILRETSFEEKIKRADLIITGEGKIDRQSLMGKVLSGVISKAKEQNIDVVAIGGKVEDRDLIEKSGVKATYEIADPRYSLEENMRPETTKANLRKAVGKILGN